MSAYFTVLLPTFTSIHEYYRVQFQEIDKYTENLFMISIRGPLHHIKRLKKSKCWNFFK